MGLGPLPRVRRARGGRAPGTGGEVRLPLWGLEADDALRRLQIGRSDLPRGGVSRTRRRFAVVSGRPVVGTLGIVATTPACVGILWAECSGQCVCWQARTRPPPGDTRCAAGTVAGWCGESAICFTAALITGRILSLSGLNRTHSHQSYQTCQGRASATRRVATTRGLRRTSNIDLAASPSSPGARRRR